MNLQTNFSFCILTNIELLENNVFHLKRPQMSLHKWAEIQISKSAWQLCKCIQVRHGLWYRFSSKDYKTTKKEVHAVEESWHNYPKVGLSDGAKLNYVAVKKHQTNSQ